LPDNIIIADPVQWIELDLSVHPEEVPDHLQWKEIPLQGIVGIPLQGIVGILLVEGIL
jgi:hypothetical protein